MNSVFDLHDALTLKALTLCLTHTMRRTAEERNAETLAAAAAAEAEAAAMEAEIQVRACFCFGRLRWRNIRGSGDGFRMNRSTP